MPITTAAIKAGYAQAARRRIGDVRCRRRHRATHTAQPTCREGIAAYWLLKASMPRGALAASPHQPAPLNRAIVSTSPTSSRRGGAVGSSQYMTRPATVASSRLLRASRYPLRPPRVAVQPRTTGVTM